LGIFLLASLLISSTVFAGSDPYYSKQWYLQKVHAPEVWEKTKGSSSIVIAVLDTGVDIDHPDLKDNIWINNDEIPNDGYDNDKNGYVDDVNGWDFVHDAASPAPKLSSKYTVSAANHGTFVAGIISAVHDNNIGAKGVTANVKIMPLVVLDAEGYGGSAAVAEAINYAVNNGADIVNLSFGGNEKSADLKGSITNAYNKGVLVVAAAGNAINGEKTGKDLTNAPIYPICYDQEFSKNMILGVLATDENSKVTSFTNYGQGCIDLAAPGTDFVSTIYQNEQLSQFQSYYEDGWNGSSFAAALVSGGAALLLSADNSLKPETLIKVLTEESGLLFLDSKYKGKAGSGLLDIKKAFDKIYSPLKLSEPVTTTTTTTNTSTSNQNLIIKTNKNVAAQLFVSTKAGGLGTVNIFDYQFKKNKELLVIMADEFKGLNITLADIIPEGNKEIVAGAARGGTPFVRVVDVYGNIISSFLAFDSKFKGGVKAAAGDVDGDGQIEIVTVPESGFGPMVKIFSLDGQLEKEFVAYNPDYKGGMNVVVGDLDNDKKAEIVVAPHQGIMPKVKVFDNTGKLKKEILAYSPQFAGGVNISLVDLDKNSKLDIITGAGPGGGPHVQVFSYDGAKLASFMAYNSSMKKGVEVKGFDWDGDGSMDIITAPGSGAGPHVKIFDRFGGFQQEFFPFSSTFTYGINIEAN